MLGENPEGTHLCGSLWASVLPYLSLRCPAWETGHNRACTLVLLVLRFICFFLVLFKNLQRFLCVCDPD